MVEAMNNSGHPETQQTKTMPRGLLAAPLIYLVLLAVSLYIHSKSETINIFGLQIPILVF